MRVIGILLIIAGLFFAVARPWFNSNFTGEEFAQTVFYDKTKTNSGNKGWQVSKVFLDKENNPVRIRIKVWRLQGQIYNNGKLKLLVRVAPVNRIGVTQAPLLNQQVTINLENDNSATLPSTEPKLIAASTKEFEISRTGQYKIGAIPITPDNVTIGNPDLNIDRNIIRIEAVVIGGVAAVSSSNTIFGATLVIFGIVVLSIFRRRKSHESAEMEASQTVPVNEVPQSNKPIPNARPDEPEIAPRSEPKTGVGKTIKWGRDAGKKR